MGSPKCWTIPTVVRPGQVGGLVQEVSRRGPSGCCKIRASWAWCSAIHSSMLPNLLLPAYSCGQWTLHPFKRGGLRSATEEHCQLPSLPATQRCWHATMTKLPFLKKHNPVMRPSAVRNGKVDRSRSDATWHVHACFGRPPRRGGLRLRAAVPSIIPSVTVWNWKGC